MNKTKGLVVLVTVFFLLTFICTEGVSASSLERDVIKIGVASALKRPFGIGSVRGAEMAANEINSAGGILGAKVKLFYVDTEATAPKATEGIERLVYTDKVDGIVGAYSSEEATAFQEQSAKLKINTLYQGTTRLLDQKYKANPEKYKYSWIYAISDLQVSEYVRDHQLGLLVNGIKKLTGINKVNVAVLTDVSLATEVVHNDFQEAIKARSDCNLVYSGKISRDAVDFTAEISQMRTKNTQLIIAWAGYTAGYTFIKQAYDLRLPAIMSGVVSLSWSVDDFIKAVGLEAAAHTSSLCMFSMETTPKTIQLLKEYDRIYKGAPHMTAGNTYNGVKAYVKAVEIAGSLNHDKVQKALEKVRLPENQTWNCKEFSFTESHRLRVSQKDGLIVYTFQLAPDGKANIIDPPEFQKSSLSLPKHMIEHWKK